MNTNMHLDIDNELLIKRVDMTIADTPTIEEMIAWENGDLDDEETIKLFQRLIDTGMVWQLQGVYGRMANRMIKAGICKEKKL